MSSNGRETEIKLPAHDLPSARNLLRRVGFRVARRRVFESNTVFDTPECALRSGRRLLRLRQVGRSFVLTYKGVPLPGPHKSREELETTVENGPRMQAILDRLGYRPLFRYEKYRTEYRQPGHSGIATIDETPIGIYLELEGPPRWIDATARKLGFAPGDYILESYGSLYLKWAADRRISPANMVFPAEP